MRAKSDIGSATVSRVEITAFSADPNVTIPYSIPIVLKLKQVTGLAASPDFGTDLLAVTRDNDINVIDIRFAHLFISLSNYFWEQNSDLARYIIILEVNK